MHEYEIKDTRIRENIMKSPRSEQGTGIGQQRDDQNDSKTTGNTEL